MLIILRERRQHFLWLKLLWNASMASGLRDYTFKLVLFVVPHGVTLPFCVFWQAEVVCFGLNKACRERMRDQQVETVLESRLMSLLK